MFKNIKRRDPLRNTKLCVKVDPYKHNVYIWERGRKNKLMLFADYDTQTLEDMMVEFYSARCERETAEAEERKQNAITAVKAHRSEEK